jgi:hypothetical protein
MGVALAGPILGSINCLAWSSEFPSFAESIIWNVSSLVASSLPMFLSSTIYFPLADRIGAINHVTCQCRIFSVPFLIGLSYVIARLCLVALFTRSLFSLPLAAFAATRASNTDVLFRLKQVETLNQSCFLIGVKCCRCCGYSAGESNLLLVQNWQSALLRLKAFPFSLSPEVCYSIDAQAELSGRWQVVICLVVAVRARAAMPTTD